MNTPNPRHTLRLGARVATHDDYVGHLHRVVVDLAQRQVVALAISGPVPAREHAVPFTDVATATDDEILVEGTRPLILARASTAALVPPDGDNHSLVLDGRLAVTDRDGTAGRITRLLVGPHGDLTALVVQPLPRGTQRSRTWRDAAAEAAAVDDLIAAHQRPGVIVPIGDLVVHCANGGGVSIATPAFGDLPSYRPDAVILADVERALNADAEIHVADRDAIDIEVVDGVVTLRGYVTAGESKAGAAAIAASVASVHAVHNNLVADAEVAFAVQQALESQPHTSGTGLDVSVYRGVVTLAGTAADAATRSANEEAVAGIPLVRAVDNQIVVAGAPVEQLPVFTPVIGQDIFAPDGLVGQVKQVIINRHNRCVIAVVARTALPRAPRWDAAVRVDPPVTPLREIVIPIEAIQAVTFAGVYLRLDTRAAARCPAFDPHDVDAPAPAWQPPYPYQPADVLLSRIVA